MDADILGWIGNIFFILGAIYIARRKVCGFYFNASANAFYVIQAILLGISSLATISIILICINIYGTYNWSRRKVF